MTRKEEVDSLKKQLDEAVAKNETRDEATQSDLLLSVYPIEVVADHVLPDCDMTEEVPIDKNRSDVEFDSSTNLPDHQETLEGMDEAIGGEVIEDKNLDVAQTRSIIRAILKVHL